MRTMVSKERGSELKVHSHHITKNFWEYYLEEPDKDGNTFGFVMGLENELWYVNINEIEPYVSMVTRGEVLNGIMPAEGFEWEDAR